jgi:uncharacterized MAPEG superfamily protein
MAQQSQFLRQELFSDPWDSVHSREASSHPIARTLLTLFGSVGVYRWSRILTGRASIAEWRADLPQGSEWYQRAMRAHMNCVENLPVYAAVVVALVATGVQSPTIDGLASPC